MNLRDLSVSTRVLLAFGAVIAVFGAALLTILRLGAFNGSASLLALAAIGMAAAFAIALARAIKSPLDQAIEVLAQIEKGHYETPVAVSSRDETGKILAALVTMQRSLKERMERDRAAAVENGRIRAALDRASAGAMLADEDGKVIYVNDAVRTLLRDRASEIRKQLPQFDPERILGSSIDAFHRVPSHQRNVLAGLTSTHTVNIKFGLVNLRLLANPVVDADGKRIGTVVQWIDRTQEVETELEVQTIVARALDGDLTARIREEGKDGFFKALAAGMNNLIGNMADMVLTMAQAAGEVRTGAEEISLGNNNLSQRTEEQAASLEETASSMQQMTATVKNSADNASRANQMALAARALAERGGAVVNSAIAAMSEINVSSKKIADIIGVIDEIAFQTNLLALNAAVEAARAGEQGRGFAVVASEVRNLASRSAGAAKEIKGLIGDSVSRVTEGTKLVDESGRVLGDIVTGVKKVTDVVAEIAASSQEQASGIEQVNRAVVAMDETTQQNAALVEEASAAARALTEQAVNLTQLMARYRVGDVPAAPAVDAPTASMPERRAPARPWSGKATPAAPTRGVTRPRKAAAGVDGEWQEF